MTIFNRKAKFNYHILETLEAGIVLKGTEVKSIRQGKASMDKSYIRINKGELWIENMNISHYEHGNIYNHEPNRDRKILVHRKEILKLQLKVQDGGKTIVPLKLYMKNGKVKLSIALAQGKRLYDKRETEKRRDVERAMRQNLRSL